MTLLAVDFVLLQVFLVASSESDVGYQQASGKSSQMSLESGKTTWTTAFDSDAKRAKGAKVRRKRREQLEGSSLLRVEGRHRRARVGRRQCAVGKNKCKTEKTQTSSQLFRG